MASCIVDRAFFLASLVSATFCFTDCSTFATLSHVRFARFRTLFASLSFSLAWPDMWLTTSMTSPSFACVASSSWASVCTMAACCASICDLTVLETCVGAFGS